jgi:hypothetical protein
MSPDKRPYEVSHIPDVEHWVIMMNDSVYIPGDERSRTNPGHGYPAETRKFLRYEVYLTEEKFLQVIKELEIKNEKNYKALKVTPLTVKKEITISVGA